MGKNELRKDMTCLNCRHVVEKKFCPNCGQKNEDTRKTFHHLFVHFFEDLTHYENAFWRTIRNLLLKPASLTKEYLSGKRLSYLAPVRLYIFISFVTFFILTVFPNEEKQMVNVDNKESKTVKDSLGFQVLEQQEKKIENMLKSENITKKESDSLLKEIKEAKETDVYKDFLNFGYGSIKEMDSVQKYGKKEDKLSDFEYWINKKVQLVKDKNNKEQIIDKFKESFVDNFPKVLFIYMPIFAFVLWLFHNKKRWYYFDHGIFTLHYFSFLLLLILIQFIFNKCIDFLSTNTLVSLLSFAVNMVIVIWMLYYFYPAHKRFYGETKVISFLKSSLLFFINFILITFILVVFAIYTFINIH